jgi:hypothetical protein
MKISTHFFLLLVLFGCKSEPVEEAKNKILPIGASRVEGDAPEFYSYRYPLWSELIDNEWSFDFIGNEVDTYYYGDDEFDPDHEGHGGWTSGQILTALPNWLSTIDTPDVVLISSPGGNDALDGLSYSDAMDNIEDILETLQSHNPEVTIVIEIMAPAHSGLMTGDLLAFYEQMETDIAAMANDYSSGTSQVIAVDMGDGFSDAFLADPIHYNQQGAEFIGHKYYTVLEQVLSR